VPARQPNAFATGRSPAHAAVAVTDGLLEILDNDEVEGVLAHEIAHIRNRDTLIMTVAATFAGALTLLADMVRWSALFGGLSHQDEEEGGYGGLGVLALAIVAPTAALLLQLAISRSREYAADELGARLCGRPLSLANALVRIERAAHQLPMVVNPATAPLYIVHPFAGGEVLGWIGSLFQTHPPTEARVHRLYALSRREPRQTRGWAF
jgi:heat shock protein HtpX